MSDGVIAVVSDEYVPVAFIFLLSYGLIGCLWLIRNRSIALGWSCVVAIFQLLWLVDEWPPTW